MIERSKEQWPRLGSVARGLSLVLAAVAATLVLAWPSHAEAPGCQPPLEGRQRYGFVALSADWWQTYDTAQLNAGWYVDFSAPYHSAVPQGMDRGLVIRVYPGYRVDGRELGPVIDRYPGATWLIGNEPDCIWQDGVLPEEYARIYHDLYAFIKKRDLSGRVAAGGIVQPTPLRLEYLDRVLAAYHARYGQAMPVDVWHIHNAILNEVSCAYDDTNCWGADVPPGIDAPYGEIREISDNDNMTLFAEQIWAFRQWMADRGYGGYPLIVTEYGILMPDDPGYDFDVDRVNAFMSATFAFFEGTSDPVLGDPADGNRLVQRWAWFSLNAPPWDPNTYTGFNGNLFDPDTLAITDFGLHYGMLTASFPALEYTDLSVSAFRVAPVDALASPTQTVTRSLSVRIVNIGTAASGSFAVDLTYTGPASGALQGTVDGLDPFSAKWITFTLADLPPGTYTVSVEVDPAAQVAESLECNNTATTTLLAPSHRLHLPVATQRYGPGSQMIFRSNAEPVLDAFQQVGDSQAGLPNLLAAQSAMPDSSASSSPWLTAMVPTGNSYPAQIAVGPDGTVWITERDGNKIGKFDPLAQSWQEYEIPTAGSQPWGIALDADGNVWLAETAAAKIAMLDVAGGTFNFVEYGLPTGSEPWDVAVSGDGAIWFSARGRDEIGKLMPGGTPVWYGELTPESGPAGLSYYGSYVYFAEPDGDRIARLDPEKPQVSESFRGIDSEPQDVAVTPGGAPWFVETGANRIFLLNPTTLGMSCTVLVRTSDSEPYGIAVYGNNFIWFTERAGNKLGLYRHPLGRCSSHYEFQLPIPNSQPTGIAIDGDGCAWFTAPGANYVGRYCLNLSRIYLPVTLKSWTP